jgi:ubiquinone biosynthesis protein
MVQRVLVATDRSESASRAVDWAADMANRFGAELVVLQIVVPANEPGTQAGAAEATRAQFAAEDLRTYAEGLAGERDKARVVVATDIAAAIVETAEAEGVDVVVVGNLGMQDRREFLLGNVPNRVSHSARCSVIIVNTADLDGDRRPKARSAPAAAAPPLITVRNEAHAPPPVEGHLLGRAARISSVMARFGASHLFASDKEEAGTAQARRLRTALEELGPTFAKLGQILSTRADLLPPAFVEELATLQDQVPPLGEAEVVAVMEQELGVPWEDVFESIEQIPMAAGTIAEVHRATLTDGERVVVKVQRPTAERDILLDLGLFERFAAKTSDRPAFRQVVDMPAIIEHLSASLKRELDFRQEAANVERMRVVLAPYPRLEVPKVYHGLSSKRLLVMEEVQGVPIREVPEGQARKEAARQLLESYYRQILVDGFFHADPHPGNLLWWNDTIYFLDFGMIGEVGPQVREQLMLLLMAFWQEDVGFLSDVVLMLAGEDQRTDIDIDGFTGELGELVAKYRHLSLKEIQLGPILQEITEIAVRYDVRLPASLALTGKALAQMQLATAELDPTLDPFTVAGQFVMKSVTGRVRDSIDPKKLFYEGQKAKVRFVRLVEAFERLAGARPGPKLTVNFRGTERLEDTIRHAGTRLSLALAAGGALIGTGITAGASSVADWVPITLGVVGGGLTFGLVWDLIRGRHRG